MAIRDNIYSIQPDLGGILVHLLPLEGLEAINAQKEFSFSLGLSNLPVKDRDGVICDCSVVGQNKQNCSAWTYLRKDLPPIVYSYPSSGYGPSSMRFWTPSVGLIINPSDACPIITTMGVIDSATDARNCGSQDPGYVFNIFDPKNDEGRCVVSVNGDQSYYDFDNKVVSAISQTWASGDNQANYFGTRITVANDSSGIVTAFNGVGNNSAELRDSIIVGALGVSGNAGQLYFQQVQIYNHEDV